MRWLPILLLLLAPAAHAAPYTLKFRNPDTTRAYTQLRTAWGIVAAPCAPGATCSITIDIPVGRTTVAAEATDGGGTWSLTSNSLTALVPPTPAECLALPSCRFDATQDGIVLGDDFKAFTAAFGTTWVPAAP